MGAKLFSSYTIKDVTLKNRIVMSPMCMYSCKEDGIVQNWHKTHYTSRAVGGAGLIITEAAAVTKQGRITNQDLGIWNDDQIAGLSELVSLVKEQGAKIGIQLAHAGRKAQDEEEIIAPSSIAFSGHYKLPKEMTKVDIQKTVLAFRNGADRAAKAGFEVIELHAAHGYLINEFLSPLSNRREDEYGGSEANRYRFLKEIIASVREVWNGPLFVRLSAHDYSEGGMTAEQYTKMVKWMKEEGADLIDVSSGAVVPAPINPYPGYQVPFSETIKHGAELATGAVGLITTGTQAEEILQNNRADVVFIGRELLRNPYWPRTAAEELKAELESPKQYDRAW
ncbi:NADPH dehydrogenase NamA [Peribacillus sp. B-H-3]|uniref:NADPH dehydrogenase NamA n=1 Tax=Peribacillus sp. B-H-3 TaxID=3400420 RepID=UPI003B01DA81